MKAKVADQVTMMASSFPSGDRTGAREKAGHDLDQFLAARFCKRMVEPIKAVHLVEEGRPIETTFDVTVAGTAHARSVPNTDRRLEIEREVGQLLQAA
jgi:hypothetical protein